LERPTEEQIEFKDLNIRKPTSLLEVLSMSKTEKAPDKKYVCTHEGGCTSWSHTRFEEANVLCLTESTQYDGTRIPCMHLKVVDEEISTNENGTTKTNA